LGQPEFHALSNYRVFYKWMKIIGAAVAFHCMNCRKLRMNCIKQKDQAFVKSAANLRKPDTGGSFSIVCKITEV
jgi:hypothetical protein